MGEHQAESSRTADAWDSFLALSRPDIGFKQSSWWADFSTSRGWRHFGMAVREGNGIVGGSRVLINSFAPGKCFYYIPHGPVLPQKERDAEQVFEAILEYIDQTRKEDMQVVSHLRLEPRWEHLPRFVHGCRQAGSWLEPRRTLCMDLDLSETALLQQMKPKGRYNIRVARRHGVAVVEDTSRQGVKDFFNLYAETLQRHGIRGHSNRYFGNLTESLFPFDRGSIFFAEWQGVRLATALIIFHGDTATYKYGGSRLTHRHLMAPYLLHFEAMLAAKALGHKWYDFYGVSAQDRPCDRWANFSSFKRRFGGREHSFVPALDYIYDADAYNQYRARRKT